MTVLSHSPTDIRERRAASRADARASGRRPLRFHGPSDFMLTRKWIPEKLDLPPDASRSSRNRNAELTPYCPEMRLFRIAVNNRLRKQGHRSFTSAVDVFPHYARRARRPLH
jgi:hypothetical protein